MVPIQPSQSLEGIDLGDVLIIHFKPPKPRDNTFLWLKLTDSQCFATRTLATQHTPFSKVWVSVSSTLSHNHS